MKTGIRLLTMLGAIVVALSQGSGAFAQATGTWVSGVGDDVNPCSRTAPCKTFAGAISKTAVGGEIRALDPGGFGAVTITKSMTIDGGGGQVASILDAGTNGVNINGAGADVVLRHIRINGSSGGVNSGVNGINYIQGASLTVEDCVIQNHTNNGINIVPSANTNRIFITNTMVINNTQGGIQVAPSGGTANVLVSGAQAIKNGFGIGVAPTGAGVASATFDRSVASLNIGNGAQASGTGGLLLSNSTFTYNNTGVNVTSPASVQTFTNNLIVQNSPGGNIVGTLITNTLK